MTTHIVLWTDYTIKPGQLDAFRSVTKEMNAVSESEDGFLTQEFFEVGDGMTGYINERYRSSEEMVEHVKGWRASFADRFFAAADTNRIVVMGDLSDEAIRSLEVFGAKVARRVGGFSK
jgi:quinol monooxygenase YgiN